MFEGMPILLLIWLAVGISLAWLVSQKRRSSAGLPLAYFLGLSLIHLPGALLYLDAEESNYTRIGFEQTIIGMVAFLGGVTIARFVFVTAPGQQASAGRPPGSISQSFAALDRLALLYLGVGGFAYFVMLRLAAGIPSATAFVAPVGSLIMVGACLRLWVARESRNWLKFWSTMALLPVLPLATLVQGGFLGFGTYWVLAIVTFVFAQSKRRVGFFLLAPVVCFVGLSVFVNYMIARNEIRQLVWYQQAEMGDRLQRIADVFQNNFEWLDLSNERHREAIDSRLNQNVLVGAAVARLESGLVEYASGATLGNMIMGLIPRALWPEKPAVGGGGTVVHDFTGMEIPEGTSVGAGQVLEFYINFGTLGVIGGFVLYGWLLGRMDSRVIECLYRGDQRGFLFWLLISLALLDSGGNLLGVFTTAVGSAVCAYGIGYFVRRPGSTREIPILPPVTNRG
jgi:hypothetical protein